MALPARIRGTRDVAAGAVVLAFAIGVLVALSRMPSAKFQAISPALFPQVCAWGLVLAGAALVVRGLARSGPGVQWPRWSGTLLVILSVIVFGLAAPRFGYAVAGFLTIVIAGFAAPNVKPVSLVVFAVGMMAVSVVLFSVVLKVPMRPFILPAFGL